MPPRPLEWMKFDPVAFSSLVEEGGMDLAAEGALIRVVRHLWLRGPLSEIQVRNLAKERADTVLSVMVHETAGWTLRMVEEAREAGERTRNQRVEAGKASAAKRNERSTAVKRKLNGRSTDVLSKSLSEKKGVKGEEKQPTEIQWPKWAGPNTLAKWEEFKKYRWAEHRTKYNSPDTEQRAVNILAKFFDNGQKCVSALDHSMGKQWQFPVDPAEYKYPASSSEPRSTYVIEPANDPAS